MFPGLQHFGRKGACWSSGMELGKMTSINYSHGPAQTKQQVGYCVIQMFLVHG
jgi:hypothetical protein